METAVADCTLEAMLEVGEKAPAFSLLDLNGTEHSLSEMLGRGPVLVALYKVSCPACQLALPYLQRISGADSGGVQIVAICQDDAAAAARFMRTLGVTLLTLLDTYESGYPVSNAFGIDFVPALFLVEIDGVISFSASGFRKTEFEALSARAVRPMFLPGENVPAWKPGCGAKN